jgi:uncharacterized protein (DUF342 family)
MIEGFAVNMDMDHVTMVLNTVSDLINKMDAEKDNMLNMMSSMINNSFQKGCMRGEEMLRLHDLTTELIRLLEEDVTLIEDKLAVAKKRMQKLFDCEIKSQFTEGHIPAIEEYLRQTVALLEECRQLDSQRSECQEEFDNEIPAIVAKKMIESGYSSISPKEIKSL